MKKLTPFLALAAAGLSVPAMAQPEFYGRAHVSFERVDELGNSGTELQSNNSRLGLRGSEDLGNGLEAVYRFEYKMDLDGDDDSTFSRRNNFIGLRGGWGEVVGGYFDTPLKSIEGSVDQFSDIRGDMNKVISASQVRRGNQVRYTTPAGDSPLQGAISWISSESDGRDDGVSASVAWERDGLYVAAAADRDVIAQGTDTARLVSVLTADAWQFGALLESADRELLGSASGWMVSGRYNWQRWAFKAQAGASDIRAEGGETVTLGADYEVNDDLTTYGFATATDHDAGQDSQYLGIGVIFNF